MAGVAVLGWAYEFVFRKPPGKGSNEAASLRQERLVSRRNSVRWTLYSRPHL